MKILLKFIVTSLIISALINTHVRANNSSSDSYLTDDRVVSLPKNLKIYEEKYIDYISNINDLIKESDIAIVEVKNAENLVTFEESIERFKIVNYKIIEIANNFKDKIKMNHENLDISNVFNEKLDLIIDASNYYIKEAKESETKSIKNFENKEDDKKFSTSLSSRPIEKTASNKSIDFRSMSKMMERGVLTNSTHAVEFIIYNSTNKKLVYQNSKLNWGSWDDDREPPNEIPPYSFVNIINYTRAPFNGVEGYFIFRVLDEIYRPQIRVNWDIPLLESNKFTFISDALPITVTDASGRSFSAQSGQLISTKGGFEFGKGTKVHVLIQIGSSHGIINPHQKISKCKDYQSVIDELSPKFKSADEKLKFKELIKARSAKTGLFSDGTFGGIMGAFIGSLIAGC